MFLKIDCISHNPPQIKYKLCKKIKSTNEFFSNCYSNMIYLKKLKILLATKKYRQHKLTFLYFEKNDFLLLDIQLSAFCIEKGFWILVQKQRK